MSEKRGTSRTERVSHRFRPKEGRVQNPTNPWMRFKYEVEDAVEDHGWDRTTKDLVWQRMDTNKWLIDTDYSIMDLSRPNWVPPKRSVPTSQPIVRVPVKTPTKSVRQVMFDPLQRIREQIEEEGVCDNVAQLIYDKIDNDRELLKCGDIFTILEWDRRRLQFENKLCNAPVFTETAEKELRTMFKKCPEKFDSPECDLFAMLSSTQVTHVTINVELPKTADQMLEEQKQHFMQLCWKTMLPEWQKEIKSERGRYKAWLAENEVMWQIVVLSSNLRQEYTKKAQLAKEQYRKDLRTILRAGIEKK
jgi:hypothetical protein